MYIEIIGSIDGKSHYKCAQISHLLDKRMTKLRYGTSFMGRPGTRLYVGSKNVVKLRSELDLNEVKTRDFLIHTLRKEQSLNVHHPYKTWFLLQSQPDKYKIGSICPRLTPLHSKEGFQNIDINEKIDYLKRVYQCYFRIAQEFNLRLDEGLSNFGVDENNNLYYLDDDIYSWDNFISFAHYLGVLVRGNSWLTPVCAKELGQEFQQLINKSFDDTHCNYRVAKLLRDIFMPTEDRRKIMSIITEALVHIERVSQKMKPQKNEYLAILSDVHANLPALDAVLAYLDEHKVTEGIVLGDIVGYGPHPNECIQRLKKSKFNVLKGNHDHAAVSDNTKQNLSPSARWCIEWTIPRLTPKNKEWLVNLPLELKSHSKAAKRWLAIHGSPIDPNYFYAYVYQMTYEQNLDLLEKKQIDLCFHGHSHMQGMYVRDSIGVDQFLTPKIKINLTYYKHSLICSGSVGQPRNSHPGAQFALYNQRTHHVKFLTIDYDMDKTLADLEKNGFPGGLSERLKQGR
ncbi:MAG: metallophosphoesterase [Methylococcales bacterium]|nr:metallophosphoesterase [Methylococcales bacterium]